MATNKNKNISKLGVMSYYSGDLNDCDSSDDDDEVEIETKRDLSFITKSDASQTDKTQAEVEHISEGKSRTVGDAALPSANELFKTVAKPDFLVDKTRDDINWEKFVKHVPGEEADLLTTNHEEDKCAIPPPVSYDPQTEALKPTLGVNSKRKSDSQGEDEDEGFENNDFCSEAKKSKLT